MIRKIVLLIVIVALPAAGFADEKTLPSWGVFDAKLSFAADDLGFGRMETLGYGFGLTFKSSFRLDVNYYRWDGTNGSVEWSVTRIPFYGGWRGSLRSVPTFYIEGGAELDYERTDALYTGPLYGRGGGTRTIHTEIRPYLVPGVGLEFPIVGKIILGVNARAHASFGGLPRVFYPTYGITIGYRF